MSTDQAEFTACFLKETGQRQDTVSIFNLCWLLGIQREHFAMITMIFFFPFSSMEPKKFLVNSLIH